MDPGVSLRTFHRNTHMCVWAEGQARPAPADKDWLRSSMEGWLKLGGRGRGRGGGGGGGVHSWLFHEKKGATMGVSQEEGSIMHGYTKPKATSEQCLSKVSLSELQIPGKKSK